MAGDFPRCPFKSEAIGSEVPLDRWCSSRQIFERGEGSFPEFSQTCPKRFLCNFSLQILSHKDDLTFFWCDLQKGSSCVFLQTLGAIFLSQLTFGGIFTQIFSKSNLLGLRFPHLQHNCFAYR